jgi:hypothetical protein
MMAIIMNNTFDNVLGIAFKFPRACNNSRDLVAYSRLCGNIKGVKIAYDTDGVKQIPRRE